MLLLKNFSQSIFLNLAVLLDLPTINEVRRTLDDSSFYKVCNLSQVLYVHQALQIGEQDFLDIMNQIKSIKTPPSNVNYKDFFDDQLEMRIITQIRDYYRNQEIFKSSKHQFDMKNYFVLDRQLRKLTNWNYHKKFYKEGIKQFKFEMRNGITPATQNIQFKRFQPPQVGILIHLQAYRIIQDTQKVYKVQTQLKTIIDYGFSQRVEEQLLTFDEQGNIINISYANLDILQHKNEMNKKQQNMAKQLARRKSKRKSTYESKRQKLQESKESAVQDDDVKDDDDDGYDFEDENDEQDDDEDDDESQVKSEQFQAEIQKNEKHLQELKQKLNKLNSKGLNTNNIVKEIEDTEQIIKQLKYYYQEDDNDQNNSNLSI